MNGSMRKIWSIFMEIKILAYIKNAFKQKTDVAHFIMGFLAGIINIFGFIGNVISAFTIATFIIYQTGEDEPKYESYVNMLEFALGFIFSIPFLIPVVW
jgi:hypothetical protein